MLHRLHTILQQNQILVSGNPLVIGVSGGPDSLCLLDLLHRLEYPLVVAHLNHGLRPEAGEDAALVAGFAERIGVPHMEESADTAAYAAENNLSIEEAARLLRYRFLFTQAARVGSPAVVVAHTADDQVETVLMHFLRGAGLSGLTGMEEYAKPNPWSDEIALVRPLLGVWRQGVLDYCQTRGIQPAFDRTNLDTTYFRNRLRHELIPLLEGYNPRIRAALWRMAQVLQGDYETVRLVRAEAWQSCLLEQGAGYVALSRRCLRAQPLGLQRQLIRTAVEQLRPGLRDIDFAAVERAVMFAAAPSRSGEQDLTAGLRLVHEQDRLYVAGWEADIPGTGFTQMEGCEPVPLKIPGEVHLPGGWVLSAVIEPAGPPALAQALQNPDPFQAWLDLDSLPGVLVVRCQRPGERFQPLGMDNGSLKLSDFMINRKIPRRRRSAWPVVAAGDTVVWVPGYSLGNPFRLKDNTKHVLHLRLRRKEAED